MTPPLFPLGAGAIPFLGQSITYRYSRQIRRRAKSRYPMPVPQAQQLNQRLKRIRQAWERGDINDTEKEIQEITAREEATK